MIDSMIHKKYVSQVGQKYAIWILKIMIVNKF